MVTILSAMVLSSGAATTAYLLEARDSHIDGRSSVQPSLNFRFFLHSLLFFQPSLVDRPTRR